MSLRIPHGELSRSIGLYAVDATDLITPEAGLSSGWSASYIVDNGTSTDMDSPTVTEASSSKQPGVYNLDIDESGMVTLPDGAEECEVVVTIKHASIRTVNRTFIVYMAGIAAKVDDSGVAAGDFDTTLPVPASGATDFYKYGWVRFVSGDMAGQVRQVTGSSTIGGKTNLAFSTAFTASPANGDKFEFVNR